MPDQTLPLAFTLIHEDSTYTIQSVLGSGAFGITYKATYEREVEIKDQFQTYKTKAKATVAIKELFIDGKCIRNNEGKVALQALSDEAFEQQKISFLDEAQTLTAFNKVPNVLHVINYFEANGTAYIIMEFVEGPTLKSLVENTGTIKEEQAINYVYQVAKGLEAVHQKSLLHCDIKPDNIIINDKNNEAVLIDFGAAQYFGDNQKSENTALTHGYAPIEQYSEKEQLGPYTDIHALGGTLYYCLVGKSPISVYDRNPGGAMNVPGSSKQVHRLLNKAMAYDASARIQDTSELISEFKKLTTEAAGKENSRGEKGSELDELLGQPEAFGDVFEEKKVSIGRLTFLFAKSKWLFLAGSILVHLAAAFICYEIVQDPAKMEKAKEGLTFTITNLSVSFFSPFLFLFVRKKTPIHTLAFAYLVFVCCIFSMGLFFIHLEFTHTSPEGIAYILIQTGAFFSLIIGLIRTKIPIWVPVITIIFQLFALAWYVQDFF